MTEAEQIFEKHIGLNTELGYLPYNKEDIIDAINEALTIQRVSICLERAKKYARHQHFLGTQGKELVEFEDWKAKD